MKEKDFLLSDDGWCFACGPHNPHGLHLTDFHFQDDQYVCHFSPERCHQGWVGIIHGGILATLLDEIMSRMLWAYGIHAMTGEITIRYHQPVPIGQRLTVRGWISRRRGELVETEAKLELPDATVAATARAKFIQASPTGDSDAV